MQLGIWLRLQRDIEIIIAQVLQEWKTCDAIILTGGYGRGEGSWFLDANSVWQPYNDYDLVIVTADGISDQNRLWHENNLASLLQIRFIDILQISKSELQKLPNNIKNYDLKYASKVIYGCPSILDNIPSFDASNFSLRDVETLYFTRLFTLFGSFSSSAMTEGVDVENSRFFRNQMAKAILAVVDALLVETGAYHWSYTKRVHTVQKIDHLNCEPIFSLATWALSEKLNPKARRMSGMEVKNLYSSVHTVFHKTMFRILSVYYNRPICSANDIVAYRKFGLLNMCKRLYWFITKGNLNMERKSNEMFAEALLVDSWENETVNVDKLQLALKHFKRASGIDLTSCTDWDLVRKAVLGYRLRDCSKFQ